MLRIRRGVVFSRYLKNDQIFGNRGVIVGLSPVAPSKTPVVGADFGGARQAQHQRDGIHFESRIYNGLKGPAALRECPEARHDV